MILLSALGVVGEDDKQLGRGAGPVVSGPRCLVGTRWNVGKSGAVRRLACELERFPPEPGGHSLN